MQLPNQSDYFFFREGIAPMWEDEKNKGGGMFQVTLQSSGGAARGPDRERGAPAPKAACDWDALWLNSLLAAVGCAVGHYDAIHGINFGRRSRGDRIQVWMGPTTDVQRREIEHDLLAALAAGLPPHQAAGWYLKFSAFTTHSEGHGGRRESQPRRDSRPPHSDRH